LVEVPESGPAAIPQSPAGLDMEFAVAAPAAQMQPLPQAIQIRPRLRRSPANDFSQRQLIDEPASLLLLVVVLRPRFVAGLSPSAQIPQRPGSIECRQKLC